MRPPRLTSDKLIQPSQVIDCMMGYRTDCPIENLCMSGLIILVAEDLCQYNMELFAKRKVSSYIWHEL